MGALARLKMQLGREPEKEHWKAPAAAMTSTDTRDAGRERDSLTPTITRPLNLSSLAIKCSLQLKWPNRY